MGGLEDPEKILEQAVSDMQNDLIRLRQAAAEVTAAQKRLQNKRDMAAQTADEWYRRAELALSKGDEELAREALTRRKAHAATATQLEGQLAQQTKAVSTIMGNMKMLEGKLQEAKLKKDTLKARAQSAKSARQIQDMVGQGKEWGHGESSCVCVCVCLWDTLVWQGGWVTCGFRSTCTYVCRLLTLFPHLQYPLAIAGGGAEYQQRPRCIREDGGEGDGHGVRGRGGHHGELWLGGLGGEPGQGKRCLVWMRSAKA